MAIEIKALIGAVLLMIVLQVLMLAFMRGWQSRWAQRLTDIAHEVGNLNGRVTALENDVRPAEMRAVRTLLTERFAEERAVMQEHLTRQDAKLDEVLECLRDIQSSRPQT